MGISHYLKEIGRGARGAKPLERDQAQDLFGQVLDRRVSDLELGAFCLAMRIKGETPQELAGFLDATEARLARFTAPAERAAIVLPSYNGARRLPLLTPLLALLLTREGAAVLVHGARTEEGRTTSFEVFEALDHSPATGAGPLVPGQVTLAPTGLLHAGLQALLEVRRVVGLRNPGHSVVKLMQPVDGAAVRVASYTHGAYQESMAATFALVGATAWLSRGMEGESPLDPRRTPAIEVFLRGERRLLQEQAPGTLAEVPGLPAETDAASTARYTQAVLAGRLPVPDAIARQRDALLRLAAEAADSSSRKLMP